MIKKIFLSMLIALVLIGAFGVYLGLQYRDAQRKERQSKLNQGKASEITIRLIEGWNNKEIAAYLEKQEILPAKDFLEAVKNFNASDYSDFLPKQAAGSLQGFLYPDTYRLFESIKDRTKTTPKEAAEEIVAKLLNNFQIKLPKTAESLAKKQGLDLYQAIILASIIEKETGRSALSDAQKQGLDDERKIVAGIFYNRLNAGMALQSDATVNYITGKSDPGVSEADSKIDSPYNTYKYRGLPPKPISNPSLSSIMAALTPAETNYFYFLHDQTTGKAVYAVTYEEHLKNKQKYLK